MKREGAKHRPFGNEFTFYVYCVSRLRLVSRFKRSCTLNQHRYYLG